MDDDVVRLHALTNISQGLNPGYQIDGDVSIGRMPVLWGRDLPLLGLPSRVLGGVQGFFNGPAGYGDDGSPLFLNPRTHSYQRPEEIAFDVAAIGIAPTPGSGGAGVARSGLAFGGAASERYLATLATTERLSLMRNTEVASVISRDTGELIAQQVLGESGGSLSPQILKAMQGNTFTHNHPKGGNFSPDDVVTALSTKAEEFRAVTPTRSMSVTFDKPPAALYGDNVRALEFMAGEQRAIGATFRQGVADGTLLLPTDLAARNVFKSDYFMQQLISRNSWIRYSETPR